MTPPVSFLVVRKLFYNQSGEFIHTVIYCVSIILKYNLANRTYTANILTSCLNISLPLTLPCARPGRYDLLLQPSYTSTTAGAHRQTATAINVQVNRYNRFANWSQLDDMEATTVIRYHNRMQRRQMMVKWERRYAVWGIARLHYISMQWYYLHAHFMEFWIRFTLAFNLTVKRQFIEVHLQYLETDPIFTKSNKCKILRLTSSNL